MSDSNEAGESSNAELPPHHNGPSHRSKYEKNPDLNTKAPELYKEKDEVFVQGRRGVDPNPYRIWKILGSGQYKLSRDGKSDGKIYKEQDLKGTA